jgi:hypothetical protein
MQINLETINKIVINLPERTDRLLQFKNELPKLFTNTEVIVQPGIINPIPYKGIADAHLSCIRMAKEKDWEYVLIMEDDLFIPSVNAKQYMKDAFNNVPNNFDICLGGIYYSKKLLPYNEYWNTTGEFCALSFYVVNKKAYDHILKYDYIHQIDRWLNRTNELKCYVTKKMFAIQYEGYSDNVKRQTNYLSHLSQFELLQ